MRRHRHTAFSALSLAAWSLALPTIGCYTYVPVAKSDAPAPGESSVVLNAAGTAAVKQKLGENVRTIDGPIARVTADSIELTVTDVFTQTGERFAQNGVGITIARADVEQVKTKTFSKKRTWTLVGVIAGVLALALGASSIASASSSGDGGGGIQP